MSNQARILQFAKTDISLTEITTDASLSAYAQGENGWVLRRMVEYKMDAHSRMHRKALKAKTNAHFQVSLDSAALPSAEKKVPSGPKASVSNDQGLAVPQTRRMENASTDALSHHIFPRQI